MELSVENSGSFHYNKQFECTYQDIEGDEGDTQYRRELLKAFNMNEFTDKGMDEMINNIMQFLSNDTFFISQLTKLKDNNRLRLFYSGNSENDKDETKIEAYEPEILLLLSFDLFYLFHHYILTKDQKVFEKMFSILEA